MSKAAIGISDSSTKQKGILSSPPRNLRNSKLMNVDGILIASDSSPGNRGTKYLKKKGQTKQVRFRSVKTAPKRSKAARRSSDTVFVKDQLNEEGNKVEADPVMALFETRNTNRVRWSAEDGDGEVDTKERKAQDRPSIGSGSGTFNIKAFMRRSIFSGSTKSQSNRSLESKKRSQSSALTKPTMVWESAETGDGPEVIHTQASSKTPGSGNLTVSFVENKNTRGEVARILGKASRAQEEHFNYAYAIKYYVKALDLLKEAKYPDDHPTVRMALDMLNNAHHAEKSFKNSADIVKMGLRHEESGELVKALKMYTIAYRIRRDNLSQSHPSLVVLLNMLGSIQMKRGEMKEAMQIYELALKDTPATAIDDKDVDVPSRTLPGNPLARSVTYRDMGSIFESWGKETDALEMYQKSLECASEWRSTRTVGTSNGEGKYAAHNRRESGAAVAAVEVTKSSEVFIGNESKSKPSEKGEMEVFLTTQSRSDGPSADNSMTRLYNSSFPVDVDAKSRSKKTKAGGYFASDEERDTFADVDVALTLHQIAQLYRKQGQYSLALDAYGASLRGMKHALGPHHPNVAAILGNIGNLHKEKGDMDSAYEKYQEVLKLESKRLGLSHPEVAITLHNIGTIEAARGNYDQALTIYKKVLALQKKLLGEDHVSVAATASCMGDVYEKLGDLDKAMELGEEALKIKMKTLGKHTIEVARMLHKLGRIAFEQRLFNLADSYITRALLIYRLNKVEETHEWIVNAHKDGADIEGALAMGAGRYCEC